jgi:hypothetical protein
VIWNRYMQFAAAADAFERRGLPVLVAENGYLGNELAGGRWYAISRNQHNGAGSWPAGGPERWDALGIELQPWRGGDGEVVVLPQRGIGPPGVAMPKFWQADVEKRLRAGRIVFRTRRHPGTDPRALPLLDDLAQAFAVVTWGSGAALKALAAGIPVYAEMPGWIGAGAALRVADLLAGLPPWRDDAARLATFRQLAWAMWTLQEIESGEAFRRLLCAS